jgi:ABC-type nitrate/sulfonate/bicarbonate transport system permease component
MPEQTLYRVSGIAVLLGTWDLAARLHWLNPIIVPSPEQVFAALGELARSGQLFSDAADSLRRVLLGFSLSVLLATPLGLGMGLSRRVRWGLSPVLQFLRPIPPVAWVPMTILWFGLGNGPSVSLTMIASFFPILMNTLLGVERIEPEHLDVARCFGATRGMILRDVILPSALPSILSGYRIGLGIAWMAVMAAEMIAAPSGLGYLIHVSQDMLRTDRVVAGMIAIGCMGFVLDLLFTGAKREHAPA